MRRPHYAGPWRTTRWDDYDFDRPAGYGWAGPRYPVYPAGDPGDRALRGALFGGLAGAIIGNNSGRGHGGRGALIGATAGLILGSIADGHRGPRDYPPPRFSRRARYYEPAADAEPAPAPPPQQVTIINNFNGPVTVMASANSLFGR
ncbi:MAG: hypothetical protein HY302_13960 [Opitutae bacterium]|nr:hypothetical protein [Opitutae bacterium]